MKIFLLFYRSGEDGVLAVGSGSAPTPPFFPHRRWGVLYKENQAVATLQRAKNKPYFGGKNEKFTRKYTND